MNIDDEFRKAQREEFETYENLSKIDELLEEYSLIFEFPHSQAEIKSILLDYAMDVIELLELKENK